MPNSFWRVAIKSARDSLRANLAAVILIQLFGVLILVSYYGFSSTRGFWEDLAHLKTRGGLAFAALSTSFFAGLLPFVLSHLSRGMAHEKARHLPWLLSYWAFQGCLVDIFYRCEALLLGDNTRPATIFAKVVIDQFAFTPLLATPLVVLAYAWKDSDYNVARLRQILGRRWYAERVLPLLGTSWLVWIPAVSLVYALPLALQLPVANLVQCLWSLLVLFLTRAGQSQPEALAST